MKANLAFRESEILKFWEENQIFARFLKKNQGKPKRILHDGPPYSNGKIHLGHAVNKIVKDFVVKFWTQRGYDSPYVPGWDTHGLPNELEAIKTFKLDRKAIHPAELRKKCKESALSYVKIQREQFKRLGVFGDWEHPYLTMDPAYEAAVVEAFGVLAQKGYIYRGKKTVHWCYTCETALAEAEIEYREKQSPSIYVKFPLQEGHLTQTVRKALEQAGRSPGKQSPFVLIWTTTPWTLPGNVAIALHPKEQYAIAAAPDGEIYLLAEKLLSSVAQAIGKSLEKVAVLPGKEAIRDSVCRHPFLPRDSVLIGQDYVTMEEGTGCVHTAPGHGQEDFEAAQAYHLPVPVPVDERGFLTKEAGPFASLHVKKANDKIPEFLQEKGFLLASGKIRHSYPHCWRCHEPTIFRATEQWFFSVDQHHLRKRIFHAVPKVKWHPSWGEERMKTMIQDRPDWCISRQRVWGVPIPVFYCETCEKPICTPKSMEAVKAFFAKEGSDGWFAFPASAILPADFVCPHCQSKDGFRKETDIFDVWFESGVSHLAVLRNNSDLSWPAQLYLEGPDQYRGWFQSSLISAVAIQEEAPYREVATNGWTLDSEGRAMHKSLGNVIDPMDILKEHGADVLRLFFASIDFKNDFRIGEKVLRDVGEAYRKIRNTFRFLLGNLFDFSPENGKIPYPELQEIDRWILSRLHEVMEKITTFYENFDFHLVYYHGLNFCVNDLSAVYFDIIKDKLYTFSPDSPERRSCQTALHAVLLELLRIFFPILSFTAEEIWLSLPPSFQEASSAALADRPLLPEEYAGGEKFQKRWEKILQIREKIYAKLEEKRREKVIRQSLEASVELLLPPREAALYSRDLELLKEVLIVSGLTMREVPGIREIEVFVSRVEGEKCARCWRYYPQLSRDSHYPDVCSRCLAVLQTLPPN